MKTSFITLLALITLLVSLSSCNSYHSIETAKSVRQLSANPFLQKTARSVLRNISDNIIAKNMTSFKGKPMLESKLAALLNTSESVAAFKNIISNTYGIPQSTVDSNFEDWREVRDVVAFVATNGKRFDFNSYSNKLF